MILSSKIISAPHGHCSNPKQATTRAAPLFRTLCAGILLIAVTLMAVASRAHEYKKDHISILHPYTSATPPGAKVAAGYFTVVNDGDTEDTLTAANASFAKAVSMHQTQMDGDIARMRELKDGFNIPAGESLTFEPGGHHLMFEGIANQLLKDETHIVTLEFREAGLILACQVLRVDRR